MVVTHKQAEILGDKELYVPTLVGENKNNLSFIDYYRDDSGEHISDKNKNYCELTAMYWAWKNLSVDYVGLIHYRRVFSSLIDKGKILSRNELETILNEVDVILPRKRNYIIENTWTHYKHNHYISDLLEVRNIIEIKYPNYVKSFDDVMKQTKSHRFNMLIMKKNKYDEYSEWLFSILFELEAKIDISEYDEYQSRVFGFLSERLLDVWIEANQIKYKELPFKFTEKQNWIKKGTKFIFNKFK